jgi:hypothetical protein
MRIVCPNTTLEPTVIDGLVSTLSFSVAGGSACVRDRNPLNAIANSKLPKASASKQLANIPLRDSSLKPDDRLPPRFETAFALPVDLVARVFPCQATPPLLGEPRNTADAKTLRG